MTPLGTEPKNFGFNKRVKLKLELGILEHMVHVLVDSYATQKIDDHLTGWYLAYTCSLFVLVCSPVGFYYACSWLIGT